MKKQSLSVVLAVFNEEKTLPSCLSAIKSIADEIVIVDGGSTDKTVQIAKQYGARVLHADNPPVFHINKQKAVDAATKDWVLQLDADEIVNKKLADEIVTTVNSNPQANGYYLKRKNYFCGKWMRWGGMWPDAVVRLFRSGYGRFPCKTVHEQIVIDGSISTLHEALIHNPYPTYAEYFRKADTYTSLTAGFYKRDHVPITLKSAITYCILTPVRTFVTIYIRHQGFRDGLLGLFWAFFSGLHHAQAYVKYMKQYKQT